MSKKYELTLDELVGLFNFADSLQTMFRVNPELYNSTYGNKLTPDIVKDWISEQGKKASKDIGLDSRRRYSLSVWDVTNIIREAHKAEKEAQWGTWDLESFVRGRLRDQEFYASLLGHSRKETYYD